MYMQSLNLMAAFHIVVDRRSWLVIQSQYYLMWMLWQAYQQYWLCLWILDWCSSSASSSSRSRSSYCCCFQPVHNTTSYPRSTTCRFNHYSVPWLSLATGVTQPAHQFRHSSTGAVLTPLVLFGKNVTIHDFSNGASFLIWNSDKRFIGDCFIWVACRSDEQWYNTPGSCNSLTRPPYVHIHLQSHKEKEWDYNSFDSSCTLMDEKYISWYLIHISTFCSIHILFLLLQEARDLETNCFKSHIIENQSGILHWMTIDPMMPKVYCFVMVQFRLSNQ